MPVQETVNKIVSRRNEAKGPIVEKLNEARKWKTFLSSILMFHKTHRSPWNGVLKDSHVEGQWNELLNRINTFIHELDSLISGSENAYSLEAALIRAKRNFVNIGIIGPWRIGKSETVQKLTGLDTWNIPTGNNNNCTACPINIINGSYNGKSNVAVIKMYSLAEMCENINAYIELCGCQGYVGKISATSVEDFKSQCDERKIELESHPKPGGDLQGFFDKLMDYLRHADDYADLLNHSENDEVVGIETETEKKAYRPRVSYYATPTASTQTFKCLATKSATLYVPFTFLNEPIGNIQILDTPGIGECKLNVAESLSKALRFDLDIAVAATAVKPNVTDNDKIQRFHEILKKETSGRAPEHWVYYLYNVYSTLGADSSLLMSAHDFIEKDLEADVENWKGITLPQSHIADIDSYINKGIICPSEEGASLHNEKYVDPESSLNNFFGSILIEMVDKIESVDNAFYNETNKQFHKLKSSYKKLISDIKSLSIRSYGNEVVASIDAQMKALYSAFQQSKSELVFYDTLAKGDSLTLSQKISEYCSVDNYGSTFLSILGIKDKKKISSFDELYPIIKDVISTKITDSNWRENQDFDEYIKLKKNLIKQIGDDIVSKYDSQFADGQLDIEKNKILDIYYTEGRLGEILDAPKDDWINEFIDMLKRDGGYSKLLEVFQNFVDYKVTLEKALEDRVIKLKSTNQHKDQFNYDAESDDDTPFDKYEKALKAFSYSLYQIEKSIKRALSSAGEGSYETLLTDQSELFKNAVAPIRTISASAGEGAGYNQAGVQLMEFYAAHGDIFKDNEVAKKNAAVIEWKKIIRSQQ